MFICDKIWFVPMNRNIKSSIDPRRPSPHACYYVAKQFLTTSKDYFEKLVCTIYQVHKIQAWVRIYDQISHSSFQAQPLTLTWLFGGRLIILKFLPQHFNYSMLGMTLTLGHSHYKCIFYLWLALLWTGIVSDEENKSSHLSFFLRHAEIIFLFLELGYL